MLGGLAIKNADVHTSMKREASGETRVTFRLNPHHQN